MSNGLFTNSVERQDFLRPDLLERGRSVTDIYIASAFFTEHKVLDELARPEVTVRLIVRLGFPTSPDALERALQRNNVQVRYFSDNSFHPKLYIFGDRGAFVGSANLTGAALISNQEVVVSVDAEDERFVELASVFEDYWSEARVLTNEDLQSYKAIYRAKQHIDKDIEGLERAIHEKIGRHAFRNIDRGLPKQTRENLFLDDYRRTYQSCLDAFSRINDAYVAAGLRKFAASNYPIRLEISLFINFVRDEFAKGETWRSTSLGWDGMKRGQLQDQVTNWMARDISAFEERTVNEAYPRLLSLFRARSQLLNASDDELFEGLCTITSFEDRLRFYPGGLSTLREAFFSRNSAQRIRESLAYLVFDQGDPVQRMANLIFNRNFKLNEFGRANVQELVGWMSETLPVINGRTTKVLRYFGFDVQQLS